jgi:type VI secretion system protein ImpL
MSDETLRQFQRAARIRAAFFPGNGNTPIVTLNVTPPMLAGTGLIAKLWISGVPITSSSQPGAVAPQQVQWTGTAGSKTDVSLEQDPPNPKVPPSEQLSNPRNTTSWALLRLLDRATKSAIPNGINASWSLLARDVSFQIITGTTVNPFDPRLFTDFKCPASLGG